jgi:hypothetical protein
VIDLDGLTMYVSSTAASGVVGESTRLHFAQRGVRVFARYAGGAVTRGALVGAWDGGELRFRYVQREAEGSIQGGRSVCEVARRADGRIRIVERFTWSTRAGTGVNVFDEVDREA